MKTKQYNTVYNICEILQQTTYSYYKVEFVFMVIVTCNLVHHYLNHISVVYYISLC